MHRCLPFAAAAVLLVGGCESTKSPWRRTLTKAERLAWVTRCGVPAASVRVDRALEFSVAVDAVAIAGRPRAALTKNELAPYIDMIADEVPLDLQPVVRRVADEPYQLVRAGAFAITGGIHADPAVWSLEVQDLR